MTKEGFLAIAKKARMSPEEAEQWWKIISSESETKKAIKKMEAYANAKRN